MRLKLLLVPALLTLAVGLTACGGDDETTTETETAPAESEGGAATGDESGGVNQADNELAPSGEAAKSEKVQIVEFTYQPDPVVVQVDGKVIWQNQDTAPHTATADDGSFDTGIIEKGKLGSETFKEADTIPYFCTVHPDMRGTVEVVE